MMPVQHSVDLRYNLTMKKVLGFVYLGLTAVTILFQIAVIFGAPLGEFTQGGAVAGSLGSSGRATAAVSAAILAILAIILALKSEIIRTKTLSKVVAIGFRFALVFNFLEFVLNWITPSQSERFLWGPVNTVLFACAVGIAILSRRR